MNLKESNPDLYFQDSLDSLRISDYEAAIESINLALTSSNNKSYYMFQKIKILFLAKRFINCANYIENHLVRLYESGSLYIFAQILHYYQSSLNCPSSYLKNLLIINNIPSILADDLEIFLNNPKLDLLDIISSSEEDGDYEICIDYCILLLSKEPHHITAYLTKARCHYLIGQEEFCISTYRQAIDLKPDVPFIYSELGNVMIDLKRYPEAIHYFQKAHELDPSKAEFMTQLAEAYFSWRKYDSALMNFKKALPKTADSGEILLRIADTYEQINKPKKAKKYYNKVLKQG